MTIAEQIRNIRQSKGLTQKQLAEKAGLLEETIRKYELGKIKPKFENLNKIAFALDVHPNQLVSEYIEPLYDFVERSSVSNNLVRIRKEKHIGQKQLSRLTGFSDRTIQGFEYGKCKPKIESLVKLSKALNVSPFEIDTELFELLKPYLNVTIVHDLSVYSTDELLAEIKKRCEKDT